MSPRPSPICNVMIEAAREAGRSLTRDFVDVEHLQVSKKGPADFVSVADTKAEDIIHEHLQKARPGFGFIMEERGVVEGTDKTHTFIIDPLDGTLNFLHGQPHFAVSIALQRDGKLIAGVVYDVAKNEIFWAERNKGAWLDQRRLRVSARKHLRESVLATGTPWFGQPIEAHAQFAKEALALTPQIAGLRRNGAASLDLAWLAAGRFDGFWERNLKPWDIAAGIVLVQEAGGYVGQLGGGNDGAALRSGNIVAANLDLAPKLEAELDKLK